MIKKMLLALALGFSAMAHASTGFNFGAATDGSYRCGTYCTGYTTDSADTVEYVLIQATPGTPAGSNHITISIDGVYYTGYVSVNGQQFTASNGQGGYALVTVNWTHVVKQVGNRKVGHDYAVSGSVSIP